MATKVEDDNKQLKSQIGKIENKLEFQTKQAAHVEKDKENLEKRERQLQTANRVRNILTQVCAFKLI